MSTVLTAAQLRAARERAGLSQTDFAQGFGVSRNTVVTWESGVAVPSAVYAARLRDFVRSGMLTAPRANAEKDAAYAAGVLWSIMQDAEHIAAKARKAHEHLTASAGPISPSREAIEEGVAALDHVDREAAAKKPKRRRA